MTKQEVKDLCDDDPQLQWWAMVLFAEICDLTASGYGEDDRIVAEYVRAKEKEFPRLIIQRQLEKVKEKINESK